MEIWEAVILGAIQGLTEFLPVSSSGHLELANYFFGIEASSNLQFTMALHAGTVLSTVVVFRGEIARLCRGVFRFRMNDETAFAANILISMLPVMFVGLMFGSQIEALFTGDLMLVGSMMLVTAGLLAFSGFTGKGNKPVTPKRAFVIGIAQAVAVAPGLSRSGATISAALMQGVRRDEAARFSFLMVLIPIVGMNILEVCSGSFAGEGAETMPLVAGFVTAFVTGALACRWMVRLVALGRLQWFAAYCLAVGTITVLLALYGK